MVRIAPHAVFAVVLLAIGFPASAGVLDFSPDSKQIVYTWPTGLAIGNLEGTAIQPVPGGEGATVVRWSPNGRSIIFAGPSEVKLFTAATGKTRSVGGNLGGPLAWREDGGRFACVHRSPTGNTQLLFYSVSENGVLLRVPLPVAVDAYAPMVWLPGSDDVAFLAADGNVYTVEAGEVHRITTSNDVIGLGLIDSGRRLVWARRSPNLHYILTSIYAYDLSARNVVRLPFPDRVAPLNPDPRHAPIAVNRVEFAPDGSRLAIIVTTDQAFGKRGPQGVIVKAVYTVLMNGQNARLADSSLEPSGNSTSARFSPDSKLLAILDRTSEKLALTISAADGSTPRVLRSDHGR